MPRAGEWSSPEALAERFREIQPPLGVDEAMAEAARCLYCFDAPCTRACPTAIDVPRFIRQILHRDEAGAGRTILDRNILGGSCARACPTEVLCEGACVDLALMAAPIPIGRLQRFACDALMGEIGDAPIFEPGPPTGRRVAIVGSGPAGLSCAHELRRLGHDVVVFEARSVPGGLDSLGIASYKISTDYALNEIDRIRRIGIDIHLDSPVSAEGVRDLLAGYDAVFLGIGLGRTRALGVEGEGLDGVWEALDFIFQTHEKALSDCTIGRHVLVLGAGNTAIDVATATRRLGAETVTIAYRRDESTMPAFAFEYDLAKRDGVRFAWNVRPVRFVGEGGSVRGVEFASPDGSTSILPADLVVKAFGQEPLRDLVAALPGLAHREGRIVAAPATGQTSIPGLFAGGDCLRRGGEVVDAVRDGRDAALGIDAYVGSFPLRARG
ncbi:NAD(P)-dependent oxidoreductase [Tundrisphaera sp. TA3]|uniref:NAD(P)-dependent oxidoreductase n=1 Tax=Tundrisphaera sp. TA3 TaxID=3435775 RepID=UPI003EB91678